MEFVTRVYKIRYFNFWNYAQFLKVPRYVNSQINAIYLEPIVFFSKIKLNLYLPAGNSTTHLTLMALLCCTIFSIYTNNLKDILMAKVDVTAHLLYY